MMEKIQTNQSVSDQHVQSLNQINVRKFKQGKLLNFSNSNGLKNASEIDNKIQKTFTAVSESVKGHAIKFDQISKIISETDEKLGGIKI